MWVEKTKSLLREVPSLYLSQRLLFGSIFFFNSFFWGRLRWVFVAARGGLLFVAVRWLLVAVASLVTEHGL